MTEKTDQNETDISKQDRVQEGVIQERARCLGVVGRHASEFASRSGEVDKRVAGALEEILRELQAGVAR